MLKKYTFRDYWRSYEGMDLFFINQTYREIHPWWHRKRYRVGGKIPEAWYYLKCLVWKRYTTVTPRSLPPTWCDRDTLLLHASFAVFLDFYEKETVQRWTVKDLEEVIAGGDDPHTKAWCEGYLPVAKEMDALYHWWTVGRPEREEEYRRRLDRWSKAHGSFVDWNAPPPKTAEYEAAWQAVQEMDDPIRDAEDDLMLKRLIDIRGHLWT